MNNYNVHNFDQPLPPTLVELKDYQRVLESWYKQGKVFRNHLGYPYGFGWSDRRRIKRRLNKVVKQIEKLSLSTDDWINK